MSQPQPPSNSYTSLISTLLSPTSQTQHRPLLPSTSPPPPLLPSSSISSLLLHPTLESALHILNQDLISAHFLLRHSQAPPAWESMYLHGILHRLEGDVENARCWYGDVKGSESFKSVWGDDEGKKWRGFLDGVERFKDARRKGGRKLSAGRGNEEKEEEEEGRLRETSLWELKAILKICETKFGTEEMLDASREYTFNTEENAETANKMLVGGEGWREF